MKFGTSIMIFFLAIVALVAEFILYFVFGLGAAFSGDLTTLSGTAFFFVSLMVLTVATGVLAPICALVELIIKKKNIGVYTMVSILGLILVALVIFSTTGIKTVTETELPRESKLTKTSSENQIETSKQNQEKGIEKPQKENQEFEEKQAYIKYVVLYDLKAGYYKTYLEEKIPGVEFKLKNKGDRTLKEVEVTVYFKDAAGTIIAEEDYHPVLVTKYSLSGDNKPLKPNYVWQMERGKFYKADSVPSEWKEGAVSAKITNIEFEG